MSRIVMTVTDEMHEALKEEAKKRGATLSGLSRKILADWLEENGNPVNWYIEWGQSPEKK